MFESTMEKWMEFDDQGTMHIVPKEYPNWYGIYGIGFIFLGEWADPQIEYKGKRCSCYEVEDSMWERFREDGGKDQDFDGFTAYMKENADEVYELCELVLGLREEI